MHVLIIVALFDDFTVQHVSKDENTVTNDLAQQAPGFWSNRGKMYVLKKSDVPVSQTEWFSFWLMQGVEICSAETSLAKPDGPVSKTGGSAISRNSEELGKTTTTKPNDWRTPLVHYLEDPGHIADRKV
jgi:hypothetical protein